MQATLLRPDHRCLHKAPAHVPWAARRMNIPALKERDRARIASICKGLHADLSKTNHLRCFLLAKSSRLPEIPKPVLRLRRIPAKAVFAGQATDADH